MKYMATFLRIPTQRYTWKNIILESIRLAVPDETHFPFLFYSSLFSFSRRSDIANLGSVLIEKISGHYKEHCLLCESLSPPSMDITRSFNLGSRYILQPEAAIQLQIWLTAQCATRLFKWKLSSIRSSQKEARNLDAYSRGDIRRVSPTREIARIVGEYTRVA